MQGIEEEVRIDLHPQRIEPRLGQLRLQPHLALLAPAVAEEELAGEAGREHGRVHQQLIEEAEAPDLAQRREDRRAAAPATRRRDDLAAREVEEDVDGDGDGDPGQDQQRDAQPGGGQTIAPAGESFREQNKAFFEASRATFRQFREAKKANDTARVEAMKPTLEANREQMKQLREQERQQVLSVLTPEQRTQWEALKAEREQRRGERKRDF